MARPGWLLFLLLALSPYLGAKEGLSLAINHGRVIDPETSLDAVRHIGISGDRIVAISNEPLHADKIIDASGLVVAPGFIDLHTHSPTPLGQYFQAFDGVTTALELEAGFYPVRDYAGSISQQALINFGASAGHVSARVLEMNGLQMTDAMGIPSPVGLKGWWTALQFFLTDMDTALADSFTKEASTEELATLRDMLVQSLNDGALGIGLPLDYFSAAIQSAELNMIFKVAGQWQAPVFVHVRRGVDGDPAGLREIIELAKRHEAPVHICHISHNAISGLELFLAEVREAREQGLDITTEVLPYNAGSAPISSAVFGRDWQTIFGISYEDVQWAETGQWFDQETWEDYRQNRPEGAVIHHYLEEKWTRRAVQEPGVIVVSDLLAMVSRDKKVAPHNGAFSKILGRYVREEQLLDLSDAIAKMTLLPARRLQDYAPAFRKKGRLQPGMDADLTLFDPQTIVDNATYMDPYLEATGIEFVIVNGLPIIEAGKLVENRYPGRRQLAR